MPSITDCHDTVIVVASGERMRSFYVYLPVCDIAEKVSTAVKFCNHLGFKNKYDGHFG